MFNLKTVPSVALTTSLVSLPALAGGGVFDSMAVGENGYTVSAPMLTIGETIPNTTGALNPWSAGDFTPVGVLDGLGAYSLDEDTVRVFANQELLHFRGHPYEVSDGLGGTFSMTGARITYFDIDRTSREIVDAGLAYSKVYDALGNLAQNTDFLQEGFSGFSRLCSSALFEAGEYGLVDTIYFAGEEDGGAFNSVGGAEWALDVENGELWQVPAFGRGAWENITAVDTGNEYTTAFVLADDTSPFDFNGDEVKEAAPLYLYVGIKLPWGNFLERNGLSVGRLYVWKSRTGELSPIDFNGGGRLRGTFVPVDNRRHPDMASEDGSTGFDEYGYPTQGNLWLQADALGAFGFSRPEDVSTNPDRGAEVVLASTGVDDYDIDQNTGNGVDTFGTIYTVRIRFRPLFDGFFTFIQSELRIIYDGDADATRALRSPDNLDWADDGYIYVQEDEAEEDTASGDEVLFGDGAVNPNEAGIVRLNPRNSDTLRVANIDRSVVLDASIPNPTDAFDTDAGQAGEWESSGILDVSLLFGEPVGTLFLFDVQAHGIEDQDTVNVDSRIYDGDLVEGGQLLFLER